MEVTPSLVKMLLVIISEGPTQQDNVSSILAILLGHIREIKNQGSMAIRNRRRCRIKRDGARWKVKNMEITDEMTKDRKKKNKKNQRE